MEKNCCPDPGCSHSLVTAATLEAAKLTVAERQMILEVLKRNEEIQKDQHHRIMKLKAELQILRRKGALKTSVNYDAPGPDPERSCGRCRTELGRVINRGAECRACRLRVCKNCRFYSTKTSEWVCTVCHKHMEIQAASGEWMNEFVRRPSRRRDNRVYVPAADLIKRTIRRSWTISNPSPRWTAVRGSPETRPYNSLPRDQDITNYPTLMAHQINRNTAKPSPARRAQSEDVYSEQPPSNEPTIIKTPELESRKPRINPLIKYASERRRDKNSDSDNSEGEDGFLKKNKRKLQHTKSESATVSKEEFTNVAEDNKFENKRVSFSKEEGEDLPIELCDIEPISGTVFRKVTVRRRRQDMKKMQAVDAGWRRSADSDLFELFLPEGDDYKLVFLSSDSSSKEEDVDDNDSCSTASSFPIDECDWDYFEPGGGKPVLNWNSPFGSPRVYRRTLDDNHKIDTESLIDGASRPPDNEETQNYQLTCESRNGGQFEDTSLRCLHQVEAPGEMQRRQQRYPCRNCGTPAFTTTQYIPIPVPVPVPIPFNLWSQQQEGLVLPSPEALRAQMRVLPRALWSYLNQAALIWPLMLQGERLEAPAEHNRPDVKSAATATQTMKTDEECRSFDESRADSEESSDDEGVDRVGNVRIYTVTGEEEESQQPRFDSSSASSDDDDESDEKSGEVPKPKKKRKTSRVYVVNKYAASSSGTDSSNTSTDSSDNDTDVDFECDTITLTGVRSLENTDLCDFTSPIKSIENPENISCDDDKVLDNTKKFNSDENVIFYDKIDNEGVCSLGIKNESGTVDFSNLSDDISSNLEENEDCSTENIKKNDTNYAKIDVNFENIKECEILDFPKIFEDDNCSNETSNNNLPEEDNFCDNLNNAILSEDLILDYSNPNFGEENFFSEDDAIPSPCLSAVSAESLNSASEASGEGERVGAAQNSSVSSRLSLVDLDLRHAARYTSLVMITQDAYAPVSVVTTDTTTLVDDVVVRHTNETQVGEEELKKSDVTVITGENTQTVVCLEEGLADDDSWVENLSHDDNEEDCDDDDDDEVNTSSGEEVTLHCTAAIDHEDELRGYHRTAIDFTLHTILEESCEESDAEIRNEPTDLEKYFFGIADNNTEDFSENSSIYSESMDDSIPNEETEEDYHKNKPCNDDDDYPQISKLEQYFLSDLKNFNSDGSVGSDSEGRPSPEQRRKRLVRARGTGRSHSSSLDNLLSNPDLSNEINENQSEDSDSDTCDESTFDKNDGQFDTLKHKKKKVNNLSDDDGNKTPQPSDMQPFNSSDKNKQQSRDSGFVGSSDDLIKDTTEAKQPENKLYNITEETQNKPIPNLVITPPVTNLTRKDSFNNWSSDEETNLMMCKMHQFFKTMVVKQPVINLESPKPSPRLKHRHKSPQLIYFENELTRLMKTVPGIRDDQVREIVEYLSSEDTWSDSYDSSDYTSSDIDTTSNSKKSVIQKQISESCKEIINKFETGDHEGDEGDGGIESRGINKETAFVYQKLVASFEKMATEQKTTPTNSPPLIAKVMHHIGTRLVALMHEVSSGESQISNNSPKVARHYHKKLQPKISSNSTTEEEENSDLENLVGEGYNFLPRSKSHDPLLLEGKPHQSSITDIAEEREVSDCERFSWRGSFESALLATDSRNKLSESPSVLAAKRRSAGDLLFTHKSLSREQLDRVRSCGSIGGNSSEDWTRRRSSVASSDEELDARSTLPRSLQSGAVTTNSLPRLPTTTPPSSMLKAQSMYHFIQQNVKSARYRPPGFNRVVNSVPKRAASAPGLQPTPQRRGRRAQTIVPNDDANLSEAHSSPMLASRTSKSATPSPVAHKSRRAAGGAQEWHSNEDDIDRLVAIHHRSSFSNLGSRSDSMASVYSGAGEGRYGTVAVKGQIEFGLQYNYKANALEINVKQCKDLASVDSKRNRSDPYVKVYLLPDKSKGGKRKTKVKKHTLNPVFDECLRFHITLNGLETRTLWLTVWHSDMFGRNDFLGEVMMNLENKVFDDPTPKWYNLQERTEPFDDMLSFKGDILIGLKFVPPDMTAHKKGKRSRGALHVLVKEAKSLTAIKANGTSDPFCKSYLLPDKGRSGKQKTSVIRRTVNPVWNHTFIYDDVTLQELAERCLELTVWDHDRLASNEFLGGVRFSLGTGKHYGKPVDWMDATGKELILWKSMLERPNFWVEGCLSLRPTLDNQTT